MKTLQKIVWALVLGLFCLSPAVAAQITDDGIDRQASTLAIDPAEFLLAHHFGNRPDWLDDPENVHGGDYSDMEDPNGDNPPEPSGQPDEDPSDNGSGSPSDNGSGNGGSGGSE